MEYKVEMVDTDELIPYERNAKKHDDAQVEQIAESIRQFGFKQNLVIDEKNVVIIGHGRLLAAKKLGMKELPCIRVHDLTEEQIRALRLADNKLNESDWDNDLLTSELDSIMNIDMSLFGFGEGGGLNWEMNYSTTHIRVRLKFPSMKSRGNARILVTCWILRRLMS